VTLSRRVAVGFLALLIPATLHAFVPFGYHRRVDSGWTLIAVSAPIDGYSACVMNPPCRGGDRVEGDRALVELSTRRFAGHLLRRSHGESLHQVIRDLADRMCVPDTEIPAPGFTEAVLHLIHLAGVRLAEMENTASALLLAGDQSPASLMEQLLALSREMLPPVVSPAGEDVVSHPAYGWWRHLERTGPPRVLVGVPLPGGVSMVTPELQIALQALEYELDQRLTGPQTTGWAANHEGALWWIEWSAPPDSLPVLRTLVRSTLEALREEGLTDAEFEAHRTWHAEKDQAAFRRWDPWFERYVIGEMQGELPAPPAELRHRWDGVDGQSVRQFVLAFFPREFVAVSVGALAAREPAWPPHEEPTERWGTVRPWAEAVDAETRHDLASDALARAAKMMWRNGPPDSLRVGAKWVLDRPGAPVTGHVIESIHFPEAIRRDFTPFGSQDVIAMLMDGGEGRKISRKDDDTISDAEARRLRLRMRLDPWNVVRQMRDAIADVRYDGAVLKGTTSCQALRWVRDGVTTVLMLDSLEGLPQSIILHGVDSPATRDELRCYQYQEWADCLYPGRLERYTGPRREAAFDITDVRAGWRLAGKDRLK